MLNSKQNLEKVFWASLFFLDNPVPASAVTHD